VHIYVVDSGVNIAHTAFQGRITRDYVTPGELETPCDFHGTWVASIAGGTDYGVAQQSLLHDLHVSRSSLDCAFYTSDALNALVHIANNGQSPMVINLSFQGGQSQCMNVMLAQLRSQGAFIVAAAGNSGSSTLSCSKSPSSSPDVWSVGATTSSDWLASFSNRNNCVRIYAPGQDIPGANFANNNGGLVASGTSASAPHLAGIGAIAWSAGALSVDAVESQIYFWALEGVVKGTPEPNPLFASLVGTEISPASRNMATILYFLLAL
jgi:subtilisin family serine protease